MPVTLSRLALPALCALALLSGCALPSPPPTAAPRPSVPGDKEVPRIQIVFEISGGIAGIQQSWIINADGSVQDQAGKTYTVPATEVTRLLNEVTAAGFFDLAASYEDIACADCFTYAITVSDGRRIKRVRMLDGGQLPDQAQQIIRLLRAFVSAFER